MRKRAPTRSRRPEAGESRGISTRHNRYNLLRRMVAKATQRQDRRPGRHGARVMVAAFGLVPWIAPLAIVAEARVLDALHAFPRHAGVKHVRGRLVFDTGEHLG